MDATDPEQSKIEAELLMLRLLAGFHADKMVMK
jgi:hypothetical protein